MMNLLKKEHFVYRNWQRPIDITAIGLQNEKIWKVSSKYYHTEIKFNVKEKNYIYFYKRVLFLLNIL